MSSVDVGYINVHWSHLMQHPSRPFSRGLADLPWGHPRESLTTKTTAPVHPVVSHALRVDICCWVLCGPYGVVYFSLVLFATLALPQPPICMCVCFVGLSSAPRCMLPQHAFVHQPHESFDPTATSSYIINHVIVNIINSLNHKYRWIKV